MKITNHIRKKYPQIEKFAEEYQQKLKIKKERKVILFPDIYIKLTRPGNEVEKNVAKFIVPKKLNKHDIANYLEAIYKVGVLKVNTTIAPGRIHTCKYSNKRYRTGEVKKAYVMLKEEFKFPELYRTPSSEKENMYNNRKKQMKDNMKAMGGNAHLKKLV